MKDIQIKEVYQLQGKASTTVTEETALNYVVTFLGHEPHIQGIFMVDSNKKFSGMISRFDLLRWTQAQLYGRKGNAEKQISNILHLLNASKAKDIESHKTSSYFVREKDTLQAALDLMIRYEQDIIPVLDNEGRIIGDLSLSEILAKALEIGIQPQP
jgi:CBS domain-containing protein